jgi:pyruvate dehydrogenase (quinone)
VAELSTAVDNKLSVNVVILKNNSLAEVKFEQKEIGNPEYGCTLAPIDFVAFAKACGADGFRCEKPEEVRGAIQAALNSPGPAVVEAVVDAEEKPAKPDELKV